MKKPGTFAYNCLLARRLAERGVRFVQLYHRGWDHHGDLPQPHSASSARTPTSRAPPWSRISSSAACSTTRSSSGAANSAAPSTARGTDRKTTTAATITAAASRIWMAGGGIKPGITYGETDDYCYNIVENPVHIHDLNATILHCLGIDHDEADLPLPGPRLPADGHSR